MPRVLLQPVGSPTEALYILTLGISAHRKLLAIELQTHLVLSHSLRVLRTCRPSVVVSAPHRCLGPRATLVLEDEEVSAYPIKFCPSLLWGLAACAEVLTV